MTAAGSAVAWGLYGLAFRWFATGISDRTTGDTSVYIAVYTGSYLLGYLALFAPGGLGVREAALAAAMTRLGLASAPDALLIAFASRLWLTVLEVVPGLVFLAHDGARRRNPRTPNDVPPR
jgi:uncharacterized membrane protein YbhN (UPF0104 family)